MFLVMIFEGDINFLYFCKANNINIFDNKEKIYVSFDNLKEFSIDKKDELFVKFNLSNIIMNENLDNLNIHPQIRKVFKDILFFEDKQLFIINDVIYDKMKANITNNFEYEKFEDFASVTKYIFDNYAKILFLLKKSFVRHFKDENNNYIYEKNYNYLKSYLDNELAETLFFPYKLKLEGENVLLNDFKIDKTNRLNFPKNLSKPKI